MKSDILGVLASYALALVFALLVHGIVAGLLAVNWNRDGSDFTDIRPYYIEARVVAGKTPATKTEKEEKQRQALAAKRNRQSRATEAEIDADEVSWEQEKKRLEEAHRRAARERAVTLPDLREASDGDDGNTDREDDAAAREEKLREGLQESLDIAVMQEQGLQRAVTDDEKALAYVGQIQRDIINNWSRPPSARNDMHATLRVRLVPTGEVIDVEVEESSGNGAFDRSAVVAVRKAKTFVVPPQSMLFERHFREFVVEFRPEDLRL